MRVCYSDGRPSKWIDEDNMTGELTFTDDDLMRLKECEIDWLRYPSRLAALIARLEAAEKALESFNLRIRSGLVHNHSRNVWKSFNEEYWPDLKPQFEAWRKAAGK